MMSKYLSFCFFSLLLSFCSLQNNFAQTYQAGVFLGASNYVGDLVPGMVALNETNTAVGAYGQVGLHPYLSVRFTAMYGKISGNDANHSKPQLKARNLSFNSSILEGSFQFMGHLLGGKRSFDPYVFAGIAGFRFNPKARYEGEWIDLQPLGTEGQELIFGGERKYKRFQMSIPMGGGIQFHTQQALTWGIEMGYRKTFTDYLDDVSTVYPNRALLLEANGELAVALSDRSGELLDGGGFMEEGAERGGADYKDGYFFIGITAGLRLGAGEIGGRRGQGCYKF
ncbi:MAG: DUF6089 family protein [Chitinophagales bacterium]